MSPRAVQQTGPAPPPGPRRRGRPPAYYALFEAIREQFGAGVWVRAVCFADPDSARTAKKKVQAGTREVPGGARCWSLTAATEDVEVDGGGVARGSALYVRWDGP